MVQGENTTVVTWRLLSPGEATLEIRPLLAFRDLHALTRENGALDPGVAIDPGMASMAPYDGLPTLHVAHDGEIRLTGHWYRSFEYEEERRRGFDFTEDLWQPFLLAFDLNGATHCDATVIASTRRHAAADIHLLRENELTRREKLTRSVGDHDPSLPLLALAADQFLIARGDFTSIIAGYPWFSDWGRDAMIALPGLTLATGRPEKAREILHLFARNAPEGLIPNFFPDGALPPEYNAVDATLWLFEAARSYVAATGDRTWVREELYELLGRIVERYVGGTRFGIRIDADGLLDSGAAGVQLTWMDAKVGDEVITPRRGKPVEVQALWFNALKTMEDLSACFGERGAAALYETMAERAKKSFLELFWNPDAGSLYDVVDGGSSDGSIRPNQILAVSLHHTMLDGGRARAVLDVVTRDLLTPYGLRTLSPCDPRYTGRYEGDAAARDLSYHQGTVWPWLMGPYIDAFLRVNGGTTETRRSAGDLLAPLLDFLRGEGTGQLPEIFDGDPPHRPRGCPAQAWSVAEVLRALLAARG